MKGAFKDWLDLKAHELRSVNLQVNVLGSTDSECFKSIASC